MRVIVSVIIVAIVHAVSFAQKPPDPEARNKQAVSVAPIRPGTAVQPHRSRPDATSVSKSGSSSARELVKIERTSAQQMKTTHRNVNSKPVSQAVSEKQAPTKNKPIKFSYQPPKNAGVPSAKNTPPPATQSHKPH